MALITLNIKDRLTLPMLFPKESDMRTLGILEDVQKKLDLTDEEINEVNFNPTYDDNKVMTGYIWGRDVVNEEGKVVKKASKTDIEKDIELSSSELDVLQEIVNKLDREKKIIMDWLSTCRKIKKA